MILIHNLTVSYNNHKNVINSLNLSLTECQIHGIVGLNGAGKTTLLNSIYGLKKYDSGDIKYYDKKLTKKDISFLVTENYFYSGITGKEHLGLFKNNSFDFSDWNELFQLPLDELIDNYSTGMKKKLALMSVLKQDKDIMILDEPFNGLDIESCRIIRSILLQLKEKGKTITITSHIIETLTNLCDHIHYLENGVIKYSAGKEDFASFEKNLYETIEHKNDRLITELVAKL